MVCVLLFGDDSPHSQPGQSTVEELRSRDMRQELETKERESRERRDKEKRSFTGLVELLPA